MPNKGIAKDENNHPLPLLLLHWEKVEGGGSICFLKDGVND
jgi:hypothetical protein